MNLLVDTHMLLWWLADSTHLPAPARDLLLDTENVVHVSAASIWEVSIKKSLGKLEIPDDYLEVLVSQGFVALPITWDHARAVSKLPPIHRDPFDRMLIAQAIAEGLTLITVDGETRKYPVATGP